MEISSNHPREHRLLNSPLIGSPPGSLPPSFHLLKFLLNFTCIEEAAELLFSREHWRSCSRAGINSLAQINLQKLSTGLDVLGDTLERGKEGGEAREGQTSSHRGGRGARACRLLWQLRDWETEASQGSQGASACGHLDFLESQTRVSCEHSPGQPCVQPCLLFLNTHHLVLPGLSDCEFLKSRDSRAFAVVYHELLSARQRIDNRTGFPLFRRLEAQGPGTGRSESGEGLLSGPSVAVPLCVLMWQEAPTSKHRHLGGTFPHLNVQGHRCSGHGDLVPGKSPALST